MKKKKRTRFPIKSGITKEPGSRNPSASFPSASLRASRAGKFGMTKQGLVIFLFGFFLPTQLGKHFFLPFSYLSGVRIDYLAPTLYVLDIIIVGLYIAYLKNYKELLRNIWIQLFLFVTAIGLFFAISKEIALYRYIKIIELLIVGAALKTQKKNPVIFLYGLFLSTVVQFCIATAQFIHKSSLDGVFYFLGERHLSLSTPGVAKTALDGVEFLRAYGTFSHPNSLAGFYLLIYAYLLFQKKNALPLILNTCFLLLCSALIFLSFSKVAMLGLLLLTIKYFIVHWKEYKNCTVCVGSRIMAVLIPLGIIASSIGDPLSGQKRIELMLNSFSMISANALTGVGLGNYVIAQEAYPNLFQGLIGQPVHNIFLLVTAEVGLIIAIGLLIALANYIRKSRYNYQITAVFFVLFLTGMFDHYWITLEQNWLLVATIVALL